MTRKKGGKGDGFASFREGEGRERKGASGEAPRAPEKENDTSEAYIQSWRDFFIQSHFPRVGSRLEHLTSVDTTQLDFRNLPPPTPGAKGDLLLDTKRNEDMDRVWFYSPDTHPWMKECIGTKTLYEVLISIQKSQKELASEYRFPGFTELRKVTQEQKNADPAFKKDTTIIFASALVSNVREEWSVGGIRWNESTERYTLELSDLGEMYEGQIFTALLQRK